MSSEILDQVSSESSKKNYLKFEDYLLFKFISDT